MTNLIVVVDSNTLEQIFTFALLSFLVSMVLTPFYTTATYAGKWWVKVKEDKKTFNVPTMAGTIFILATVLVTVAGNLSRSQTWLPLAAMVGAGLIGLVDDAMRLKGFLHHIARARFKLKMLMLALVSLIGGWWFYSKLGVHTVDIPFGSFLHLGWLIVPLFMLVVLCTANAVNITDGMDGLAGGLTASAFGFYSVICLIEGKYGLAGFCMTVLGALLSYTWFNIPPARFFMGDVGTFALGTALGVVAMLTNTVLLLPVIGLVFVLEAGSVLLQVLSKQLRGGKTFFSTVPLHYHFEQSGWPPTKVTMRFWILGWVAGLLGVSLFILGGVPS